MHAGFFRKFLTFIILTGALTVAARSLNADSEKPIGVVVSIAPLAEFVEQIGESRVDVTVMVPAAVNEHTYEPAPDQLKALSKAGLYVAVGSGIEFEFAWLERFQRLNPRLRICDASQNVRLITGEAHGHAHSDPHIWLSPKRAQIMAAAISGCLSEADRGNQDFYNKNLDRFQSELQKLETDLSRLFSGLKQRDFLSAHSAWRYFAQDFGLNEIAIESEGKEPSASEILKIIEMVKQKNIRSIFTAPQFSKRYAEMIAKETGARLVEADPLSKDYIQNLREFANHLKESS